MSRCVAVMVTMLGVGCTAGTNPATPTKDPVGAESDREPARTNSAASKPKEADADAPADASDPCDPEPGPGDPCTNHGSYCVIDWGEPGGYSTAMWCRDGRWEREQEVNLPQDGAP